MIYYVLFVTHYDGNNGVSIQFTRDAATDVTKGRDRAKSSGSASSLPAANILLNVH